MTTYIPALTIPYSVFANPAASILLPIGLGAGIGYSTRRQSSLEFANHIHGAAY